MCAHYTLKPITLPSTHPTHRQPAVNRLTFIDGDKGVLLHRGYTIEDLTEKASFLEVAHLLLYGDLPNADRKAWFEKEITYHTMVHEQLNYFFRGFRRDAHPMSIMCGVVGGLSSFITTRLISVIRHSERSQPIA